MSRQPPRVQFSLEDSTSQSSTSRARLLSTPDAQPGSLAPPRPEAVFEFAANIRKVLEQTLCYDCLSVSGRVDVIDVALPLSVAFLAAMETSSSYCLLWESGLHVPVGFITATDYMRILLHLHAMEADLSQVDEIRHMSVEQWLRADWVRKPSRECVVSYALDDTALDCLLRMTRDRIHRLPVLQSTTEPTVCGIISHDAIVALLVQQYFSKDDVVLDTAIMALGVGKYGDDNVHTLSLDDTVADAIKLFLRCKVHTLAILDDDGVLVDAMHRDQVLTLELGKDKDDVDLNIPLRQTQHFKDGKDAVWVYNPKDSFRDVAMHLIRSGVSTILAVNDDGLLVGSVTVSDIIRYLHRLLSDNPLSPPSPGTSEIPGVTA